MPPTAGSTWKSWHRGACCRPAVDGALRGASELAPDTHSALSPGRFLDAMMYPEVDGYALAEEITRDNLLPGGKMISMLSSAGLLEDRRAQSATRHRCATLIKPVEQSVLRAAFHAHRAHGEERRGTRQRATSRQRRSRSNRCTSCSPRTASSISRSRVACCRCAAIACNEPEQRPQARSPALERRAVRPLRT